MRATRAYITGFGTTGALIAAAFMTLLVMSAYVAFNGFPGQDVQDPIGSLLVPERQAAVTVSVKPIPVKVAHGARTAQPAGHHRRHGDASARRAIGPRASTGPVKHRLPAQLPASRQAPAGAAPPVQNTVPLQTTAPQLPAAPHLPSVGDVLPDLNLPQGQTPAAPQLPLDGTGMVKLVKSL